MSKSNHAVRFNNEQIETVVTKQPAVMADTIVSGIDESGTWVAEQYAAEQAKIQTEAVKPESTMSAEVAAIVDGGQNKSTKIRGLLALGLKRGEVAKLLGVRYQHVRNVEITPVKRVS